MIMYADTITDSMRVGDRGDRTAAARSSRQYNEEHGITPTDDSEVGAGTDLCFQEDRKGRNEFQEVSGVDEQGGTDETDRRYPEKDGKSGGGSQF